MKLSTLIVLSIFFLGNSHCSSQTTQKMQDQKNPLLCDTTTAVCEIPTNESATKDSVSTKSLNKPIKIIYYTDPICSSCWGIEPQLRKLKLEYGNQIEIEYRMGGLLPDWSYNSGGISKPSDVAHHWDEVSVHYDMPIDGDVWLEDPLPSSYPPSIAFKAAQMQSNEKAILFLREVREMVFLQKKNIAQWENLEIAAQMVGLDLLRFKKDFENEAKIYFQEDLKLGRELGVRGFPTLFFSDINGNTSMMYGSKAYAIFENTLLKLYPSAVKNNYNKSWDAVFAKYPSLTAREFSELTLTPRNQCEDILNNLTSKGILEKTSTKNGSLWKVKKLNK